MFLADLHVHTTFSDGRHSLEQIVDLYGSLGFGAIAVTDHLCEEKTFLGRASRVLKYSLTRENFGAYQSAITEQAERAWKQYRMVLLPGFELTKNFLSNHRSAHIVAVGVDKFISAEADVFDLAKEIRAQGAIAIAAHPVWTRKVEKQTFHLWDRREELANSFDAWEVASGPYLFDEVAQTKLPKIASSDLHAARQMRAWKTVFDCERSPQAILEAVRRQDLRFHFYNPPEGFEQRLLPSTPLAAVPQGAASEEYRYAM